MSSPKELSAESDARGMDFEMGRSGSLAQAGAPADRIVRLGLWAIPAAGVLIGAHWLFPEGPQTPEGIARHFTSPAALIVQEYMLFLGGLILLLLGVIALSAYLYNSGARRSAAAGLILSVSGMALFLPVVAIPILVYPMVGQVYLAGHPEIATAMELFNPATFNLRLQTHLFLMLFVSIAGAFTMAVAIWRSGKFPRWAGVVYAIAFSLTITVNR